jgi:hypothetical protein
MSETEKQIQLGLTSEASQPITLPSDPLPAAETPQFRKAEHAVEAGAVRPVSSVRNASLITYFHAQGQVVCATCATTVQAGQNAPPAHTLLRSFFYGLGAAIAGTALFSIVWITKYMMVASTNQFPRLVIVKDAAKPAEAGVACFARNTLLRR